MTSFGDCLVDCASCVFLLQVPKFLPISRRGVGMRRCDPAIAPEVQWRSEPAPSANRGNETSYSYLQDMHLPETEIRASLFLSAVDDTHVSDADRLGKVRQTSAPVGDQPRSVGRRLVRADLCHVKTGAGRPLPQWQRSNKQMRGSRRSKHRVGGIRSGFRRQARSVHARGPARAGSCAPCRSAAASPAGRRRMVCPHRICDAGSYRPCRTGCAGGPSRHRDRRHSGKTIHGAVVGSLRHLSVGARISGE